MSYADDINEGTCCGQCSGVFEEENGFPALCEQCWKEDDLPHNQEGWQGPGSMNRAGFQPSVYPLASL